MSGLIRARDDSLARFFPGEGNPPAGFRLAAPRGPVRHRGAHAGVIAVAGCTCLNRLAVSADGPTCGNPLARVAETAAAGAAGLMLAVRVAAFRGFTLTRANPPQSHPWPSYGSTPLYLMGTAEAR